MQDQAPPPEARRRTTPGHGPEPQKVEEQLARAQNGSDVALANITFNSVTPAIVSVRTAADGPVVTSCQAPCSAQLRPGVYWIEVRGSGLRTLARELHVYRDQQLEIRAGTSLGWGIANTITGAHFAIAGGIMIGIAPNLEFLLGGVSVLIIGISCLVIGPVLISASATRLVPFQLTGVSFTPLPGGGHAGVGFSF